VAVQYETMAAAYRDLEQVSSRLALIDLGLTAEQLLAGHGAGERPPTLEVGVVFETLHQIAAPAGTGSQGRKLELLERAAPLEGRYLARTVTGSLRLGVGHPTILDALALVHTSRASRPPLERAYNICSDLGLVAATLVHGGLDAVEPIQVRAGNPVRPMLAQRMSSAAHAAAWGVLKEDTGLALRFPRFTGRWRDDKAPEDATTVQEVLDLYASARPTPAGS
jgi:ATP-dependent DNA ligase